MILSIKSCKYYRKNGIQLFFPLKNDDKLKKSRNASVIIYYTFTRCTQYMNVVQEYYNPSTVAILLYIFRKPFNVNSYTIFE